MKLPRARWLHARSAATLVVLALVLGVLWRLEVEWYGWDGLTWISTPHRAVPLGAFLFVAWTLTTDVAPRSWGRKLLLLVLGCAWAGLSLWKLESLLTLLFGRWLLPPPPEVVGGLVLLTIALVVAMPVGAFLLGRILGASLRWWTLPASVVLFGAALPLGAVAIGWFEPGLSSDLVHAVKTGEAVPFAVLGMGLPWMTRRREEPQRSRPRG